MYRSATLAIVVSSTSMNVGITTAAATTHGLIGRRTIIGTGTAIAAAVMAVPPFAGPVAAGSVVTSVVVIYGCKIFPALSPVGSAFTCTCGVTDNPINSGVLSGS